MYPKPRSTRFIAGKLREKFFQKATPFPEPYVPAFTINLKLTFKSESLSQRCELGYNGIGLAGFEGTQG